MTFDGTKYLIMKSKSGNLSEAQDICEHNGLQLFEPRNETTYRAVYKTAREAGLDQIWVNIMRATSNDQ